MAPSKARSRTGCLPCRTRRKKCDEALPSCSNCIRLDLTCLRPGTDTKVSMTNLKGKSISANSINTIRNLSRSYVDTPAPPKTISNGFSAFDSDLERMASCASSSTFRHFTAPMSSPAFQNLEWLGTLVVHVPLARDAYLALAATGETPTTNQERGMVLRYYQRCVSRLKEAWITDSLFKSDAALVAVFFLALVGVRRIF